MSARLLHVSVAWITRTVQDIVPLHVCEGTTVAQAIAASGLVQSYGLELATLSTAVAGKRRRLDAAVHDGERIDLLRPLIADPKDARRHRAARQRPVSATKPRQRGR